jgi:hypothetical protein
MKKYKLSMWDRIMVSMLEKMTIEELKAVVRTAKPGYHVAQNPDRKKPE